MSVSLPDCFALLERAPATFDALLRGLPDVWLDADDGPGTWTPRQVLGHLVHLENGDWMARLDRIVQHGASLPFEAIDREANFSSLHGRSVASLLDEFATVRSANLEKLRSMNLSAADLARPGMHPVLGEVTLHNLLATWTAHDLAHVIQISRTIARALREDVGPWAQFLSVMKK